MRSLPQWLRVRPPSGVNYERIKALTGRLGLNTVCQEARCPNIAECWGGGTATFMIMGDTCTRGCRFCSVASSARPGFLDPAEPEKLAEALACLGLSYAVITSVCRDDLLDQGSGHYAQCIYAVKRRLPALLIEALIPDFSGDEACLRRIVEAGADVVAHNLETVERLTPLIRDRRAGYTLSLDVLRRLKLLRPGVTTKSSLMVGVGETEEELRKSFCDLRGAGVEILTIGQYLRPTGHGRNLMVTEFIAPEQFERLRAAALEQGFRYVASGPFVRSSYRAGELFIESKMRETGFVRR